MGMTEPDRVTVWSSDMSKPRNKWKKRRASRAKPAFDPTQPINPAFTYRKHSPIARAVIGLGPTQMDEKIKSGELPPTFPLSESGKAQGWTGAQLLAIQKRRMDQAEEQLRNTQKQRQLEQAAKQNEGSGQRRRWRRLPRKRVCQFLIFRRRT